MFLLLVGLRNPLVFLHCVGYLLWCVVDRTAYPRFLSNHLALVQEAIGWGMVVGDARGLSYPYIAAHIIAKIKLYKASREFALHGSSGSHVWRKLFGPVTPAESELVGLAAVINKMTGSVNYAVLGIRPSQRRFEAMLIFPRYLRCLLGLLTDALQGRTRGNESRIVIASLALTVTVILILL